MNFSTDSPHSITNCGHILININYISSVGKNSSVRRKKSYIYQGLTRGQARYLHFTFRQRKDPAELVLFLPTLPGTGEAETHRHDQAPEPGWKAAV